MTSFTWFKKNWHRILCATTILVITIISLRCKPSPKVSIFQEPYAVHSPHGSVPFGAKALSPDGVHYACEVSPANQGNIGIFRCADSLLIFQFKALPEGSSNDLKGLAWSRDSRHLAVMYHGGMKPGIYLYRADSGNEERFVGPGSGSGRYYHFMAFNRDNRYICVSYEGQVVNDSFPSGLSAERRECSASSLTPSIDKGVKFRVCVRLFPGNSKVTEKLSIFMRKEKWW